MGVEQFPVITMKIFPETLEDANDWTAEMDIVLNEKKKNLFWFTLPSIKRIKSIKKKIWKG